MPLVNTMNLYRFLTDAGAARVTLDTAAYCSSPTVNGHDTGALYFLIKASNTISGILGI